MNFGGNIKFALTERGREVGRFVWVPRTIVPFVGAGVGALYYSLKQVGDFIDFLDLTCVFPAVFKSEGWTPSVQVFGGVDVRVFKRLYVTVDGKYLWASTISTGTGLTSSRSTWRVSACPAASISCSESNMKSTLLVAVFALLAMPARAQTNDARWEPWLGCWTLAVDNLRDRQAPEGLPQRVARPSTPADGAPRSASAAPPGACGSKLRSAPSRHRSDHHC